jgi:hypothetical protein
VLQLAGDQASIRQRLALSVQTDHRFRGFVGPAPADPDLFQPLGKVVNRSEQVILTCTGDVFRL